MRHYHQIIFIFLLTRMAYSVCKLIKRVVNSKPTICLKKKNYIILFYLFNIFDFFAYWFIASSKESAKYLCDSGKLLCDDASSTTSSMSSECSTTKLIRQHSKEETLLFEIKIRRCLLYNKLVDLLPEPLCQPKKNISDFVLL